MNNGHFDKGKIQILHIWADDKIGDPILISQMLKDIVSAIGMTPHGEPRVVKYPTMELGNTIFAFVAYQPLYESYIVFDNWIELDPPYANLVVNSCKDYDSDIVIAMIKKHLKPVSIRVEVPILYDGKI